MDMVFPDSPDIDADDITCTELVQEALTLLVTELHEWGVIVNEFYQHVDEDLVVELDAVRAGDILSDTLTEAGLKTRLEETVSDAEQEECHLQTRIRQIEQMRAVFNHEAVSPELHQRLLKLFRAMILRQQVRLAVMRAEDEPDESFEEDRAQLHHRSEVYAAAYAAISSARYYAGYWFPFDSVHQPAEEEDVVD